MITEELMLLGDLHTNFSTSKGSLDNGIFKNSTVRYGEIIDNLE